MQTRQFANLKRGVEPSVDSATSSPPRETG
jgi:hypothetical protein